LGTNSGGTQIPLLSRVARRSLLYCHVGFPPAPPRSYANDVLELCLSPGDGCSLPPKLTPWHSLRQAPSLLVLPARSSEHPRRRPQDLPNHSAPLGLTMDPTPPCRTAATTPHGEQKARERKGEKNVVIDSLPNRAWSLSI
jgi:hypothetical protein